MRTRAEILLYSAVIHRINLNADKNNFFHEPEVEFLPSRSVICRWIVCDNRSRLENSVSHGSSSTLIRAMKIFFIAQNKNKEIESNAQLNVKCQ